MPEFTDYSMKSRTYRYMEREALYPFGYGLSYGEFEYSDWKAAETEAGLEGSVGLYVRIASRSKTGGDEVAEVYVRIPNSKLAPPGGSLADFKRVHLEPDEEKIVEFSLPVSAIMTVDENGELVFDGRGRLLPAGGVSRICVVWRSLARRP